MALIGLRLRWLSVLAPAGAMALSPNARAQGVPAAAPSLEQAIKASYITKFPPFVAWPASAFAGAGGTTFTICVAGRDVFGAALDEIALGQKVRSRAIKIRRVGDTVPPGGCHILVLGAGPMEGLLGQVAGQPVLTVTDKSAGIGGGMIQFVRHAGRIRFEIDNGAARAVHLQISSKLLGLAVAVQK